MKGLTHFTVGVAAATFFGGVSDFNQTFLPVVGGIFGIMPDTLDFKFGAYLEQSDYIIDPDPKDFKPQDIADTIAKAANQALATGKEVHVQLHTVQLAADLYRRYSVQFDTEKSEVVAAIGPLVNMSQVPISGTELNLPVCRAKVNGRIKYSYDTVTNADIMRGPSFGFVPEKDGSLRVDFLPWHRSWSHSLTLAALFGVVGWLVFGGIVGLAMFLGFALHVAVDFTGFMGSNLFWPVTKKRMTGLKIFRSNDAIGNFMTVWTSCMIIVFNLNRFASQPAFDLGWVKFFLYTVVIPGILLVLITVVTRPKKGPEFTLVDRDTSRAREVQDELSEGF